jgi:serine phosphatase RsbU (regulator of sigma subunit)
MLGSDAAILALRDYYDWQKRHHGVDFVPSADDDVDLRSYFFSLHTQGLDRKSLESQVAALKQFYQWAYTIGLITHNPFDEYIFSYPILTTSQISPRSQTLPSDPNERELERLRALSQITEQLNSAINIQTALDNTLKTLLKVMDLKTGWVSLLTGSGLNVLPGGVPPPHGFILAAACELPPGLELNERHFLRKPPACNCQRLLKAGRLTRAVNIVECTRLRDSMRAAGNNAGLRYHASVPLISNGKPLGLINAATSDWQFLTHADLHFLSAASAQVVVALERANLYEIAENRRVRLEEELAVARDVQVRLMPNKMPYIPDFELADAWRPAREVAGDFYDIFPLEGGRWGIMIGDVAGKGTAAALYMAMIHSLILSSAQKNHKPSEALLEVNRTILKQSSMGIFVTVFLAVLDPNNHTLLYANAGHNPPILRHSIGRHESLTLTGAVLGVLEELTLSEREITLTSEDVVVLYTDGVTEALHPLKGDYGIERLTDAVASAPGNSREILAFLTADLDAFIEGAPQQDDITLLILKCMQKGNYEDQ